MKSLIYLELINEISFTYKKEFLEKAKQAFPYLESFDLDSFSEVALYNYAIDLIKQSDQFIFIVMSDQDASVGKSMGLFETIIKHKEKAMVILQGDNKMMEKISRQFKNVYINQNLDASIQLMKDFLIPDSHSEGNNA